MNNKWIEVTSSCLTDSPPDFLTHLNYVEFMRLITNELTVGIKAHMSTPFLKKEPLVDKKINLIKLTLDNIEQEFQVIQREPEFAQVCVSWISVKSYYLIFNALIVLRYLRSGDKDSFYCSHTKLINELISELERGDLYFGAKGMNKIFDYPTLVSRKIKAGANIKTASINLGERYIQILKKIAQYKEQNFRYKKGIISARTKQNREAVNTFRSKMKINLFEFLYWYRIKANYRDMEFLNKNIPTDKFKEFYDEYYYLTQNIYLAFKKLINDTAMVRFHKPLI